LGVFFFHPDTALATNALDYASSLDATASTAGLPTENQTPTEYAIRGIQVFMGLIGIIALILIIYGGFLMLTSAGNEERISEGKKIIQWVVIGILIILLSVGIVQFIGMSIGL
jgi:uncharacterized membrane protein